MRKKNIYTLYIVIFAFLPGVLSAEGNRAAARSFLDWSQAETVGVLNQSGWARTVTFTRVVPGIGSGVSGEKEIYNAFYVRFLSARPIREAYTRIQLIKHGFDLLSQGERARFSGLIEDRVARNFEDWVVVAVSFRSNDPTQESVVREYFASQTGGTLMNRAFLSTDRFSQVRLAAYYPPVEEEVGARFVFPRTIDGTEVISKDDAQVVFELTEVPGASSAASTQREKVQKRGSSSVSEEAEAKKGGILRASFDVAEMSGGRSTDAQARPITLAGIGALEMRFGELGFSSPQASIQNIAEIANPFKARKRGRFYGSLYEYHRNDNFDARNFFDPVGQPLPEFKRNQFGVSFGAFLSDRLKVFGTFDGLRIVRGSTLVSHIATPEMKQGEFGILSTPLVNPFSGELFENNRVPQNLISPVAEKMLGTIPAPNRDDPQRNFVNNSPSIENVDDIFGRIDYEHSADTKLFGRYSLNQVDAVNVAPLPTFGTNENYREQILSMDLNRNMGPRLVSSLSLSFRRVTFRELSKNVDQVGLLDSLGIAGVSKADDLDEGYPYFRLDGYANMGLSPSGSPKTRFNTTWGTEGYITWTPPNHNINFGGRIGSTNMNNIRNGGYRRGSFRFSGTYTGDAFADFLLGIPDSATRSLGSDRGDYRKTSWSLSFRDEWKVTPKINLSFTLAYYRYDPWRSAHDNVSIFWPLLFEPPADGELVVMGSERASAVGLSGLGPGEAVYVDRNNWAPGIGFAYSPLGNNRLVLRSSYRITYSPVEYADAKDFMGRNYPFFYLEEADAPSNSPDVYLSNPFQAVTASETTVRGFDPHIRDSYTQHWQLELQNEFMRNWTLEIGYSGRKTARYNITLPANIPLPGPGAIQHRRPNPGFGRFDVFTGGGSSAGHSLHARINKRLSQGFSVRTSFTWDRYFNDIFSLDPSNPRNRRAERAVSGYPPILYSLNYIYDIPFGPGRTFSTAWAGIMGFVFNGWRLSGITNITGGRPFTPLLKGDANNDGSIGDRPDRIGSGWLASDEQSIDRWFVTEDFAKPAAYGFGNSGRHILLTPMQRIWDISLIKRTNLSREGSMLEFRVQFFNAFNHANFNAPEEVLGTSTFGRIFGADEGREIEIALKFSF